MSEITRPARCWLSVRKPTTLYSAESSRASATEASPVPMTRAFLRAEASFTLLTSLFEKMCAAKRKKKNSSPEKNASESMASTARAGEGRRTRPAASTKIRTISLKKTAPRTLHEEESVAQRRITLWLPLTRTPPKVAAMAMAVQVRTRNVKPEIGSDSQRTNRTESSDAIPDSNVS